jgi:hypothetical protein
VKRTRVTATTWLALVLLPGCGAVTQDLGNDDDASPTLTPDAAPTMPSMDGSAPRDASSRDTSSPPADARPTDACDACNVADVCVPTSCAEQGRTCGPTTDGCGHSLDCGTCMSGETCGGAGVCDNTGGNCVPQTCMEKGIFCGPTGDGCGNLLQCGTCSGGQTCGSAGMPNRCGAIPEAGSHCTPETCQQQGVQCGPAGDGCGGLLQCGTCAAPLKCGGGGPGICG